MTFRILKPRRPTESLGQTSPVTRLRSLPVMRGWPRLEQFRLQCRLQSLQPQWASDAQSAGKRAVRAQSSAEHAAPNSSLDNPSDPAEIQSFPLGYVRRVPVESQILIERVQ